MRRSATRAPNGDWAASAPRPTVARRSRAYTAVHKRPAPRPRRKPAAGDCTLAARTVVAARRTAPAAYIAPAERSPAALAACTAAAAAVAAAYIAAAAAARTAVAVAPAAA